MKKLLLITFIILIQVTCFSQPVREKKSVILKEFSIGEDDFKKVIKNIDNNGIEVYIVDTLNITFKVLSVEEYKDGKIYLYFVSNILIAIDFYPTDKVLNKEINYLNNNFYTVTETKYQREWENKIYIISLVLDIDGTEHLFYYNRLIRPYNLY